MRDGNGGGSLIELGARERDEITAIRVVKTQRMCETGVRIKRWRFIFT